MNNEKIDFKTKGMKILVALVGLGLLAVLIRFIFGIGAVSNLSDGYPWGLWIGVDVLTGVALSAGGFTLAAAVYVFGLKKYHSVVRPAILTAMLGYVLVAMGIAVDIGRGWNIWHLIFFWNHNSAMFEVGWCVMLYLSILGLEFAPIVFEEYKLTLWQERWDKFAPWLSIILISWFVFIMTAVPLYTGFTFIVLTICWALFRYKLPKGSTVIILIMAGVILSVQHQSSLGTVFLIVPTKLSSLWYSPYLPLNFLLSAVMVGIAMVIFESTLSSRVFGFGLEERVIIGLGRALPWAIAVVTVVRGLTLWLQNASGITASGPQIFSFAVEVLAGLLVPFVLLMVSRKTLSAKTVFQAATLVVIGVVINRINVAIVGMTSTTHSLYFPHPGEIIITAGIISAGLLLFYILCRKLPVFHKGHA